MLAITLIAVTISARNIPTIFTVFVTVIPMTDVRLIGSQSSIGILCPFDVFMRNNLYTAIWRFFFFAIAEAFPGHIFHLFPHTSIMKSPAQGLSPWAGKLYKMSAVKPHAFRRVDTRRPVTSTLVLNVFFNNLL